MPCTTVCGSKPGSSGSNAMMSSGLGSVSPVCAWACMNRCSAWKPQACNQSAALVHTEPNNLQAKLKSHVTSLIWNL